MGKLSCSQAFFRLYHRINFLGLWLFGRFWFPQYFGAPFPGVVAHFSKRGLSDWFYRETVLAGEQASSFFEKAGIRDFALSNGGICSFRMGSSIALYQATNKALIEDKSLSPSTGPNKKLFGDFMGTCPEPSLLRKQKRQPLLKLLASRSSLEKIAPTARRAAKAFILNSKSTPLLLETFTMELVAHVDSSLPGVLDLADKGLVSYLRSEEYGKVMREFFELASDVISKLDTQALDLVESISPLIRTIIRENFNSIKNAPETNIIKQYFKLEGSEFTETAVASLSDSFLKELGTIIVAIYDTTSLSLYWLICHIEQNSQVKAQVIEETSHEFSVDRLSFIEVTILENIRLAGMNPTALWRQIASPAAVDVNGTSIFLRKGVKLWLDRRAANQDDSLFSCPAKFDPKNIEMIKHNEGETVFSMLGNNRYEINSFSMINTFNNPRKCPGRFFSVFIQSCIIRELYGNYDVQVINAETALRRFCSMPRPDNKAKIFIKKLKGE